MKKVKKNNADDLFRLKISRGVVNNNSQRLSETQKYNKNYVFIYFRIQLNSMFQ